MRTKRSGARWSIIVMGCLAVALWAISCSDDSTGPLGGPEIEFSVSTVGFVAMATGASPSPQAILVTNGGSGDLTGLEDTIVYGASEPDGWLSTTWDSATAPAGLMLQVSSSALSAGTYTARVRVSADKASNDPKTLVVTLRVYARYGNYNEFASVSGHSPDYLLGSKITVSADCTLSHLCVIGKVAGPQMKLALYADSGGSPGALVASTPATVLAVGLNEVPLAASIALPAGDYWFMANYDVTAHVGFSTANAAAVVKYCTLSFASAMPDPFPDPNTYNGQEFNYFIRAYIP